MERGNAKHGPRQDDALSEELAGQLGRGGSNREEWTDPEPPADDDHESRTDLPAPDAPATIEAGVSQDPADGRA